VGHSPKNFFLDMTYIRGKIMWKIHSRSVKMLPWPWFRENIDFLGFLGKVELSGVPIWFYFARIDFFDFRLLVAGWSGESIGSRKSNFHNLTNTIRKCFSVLETVFLSRFKVYSSKIKSNWESRKFDFSTKNPLKNRYFPESGSRKHFHASRMSAIDFRMILHLYRS
jgi:hypothetical protein